MVKLSEATSGVDYNRLGVNAERVILDRASAITAPKDRPLHLHKTGLQIEATAEYTKQKPWWEKRDPLRPLLPEEAQAAQTAADVSRAIDSLEGGVGTSGAAERDIPASGAQPRVPSEEGSERREGKASAHSEDPSSLESEEMDEQPLAKRRRRLAVLGPRQYQTGMRPTRGILIWEPNEGFSDDIDRKVDAFLRQPDLGEEAEEVVAADPGGDQLGSAEGEGHAEPEKVQEVPSSSFPSFQTLNSGDLGFSAPRITVPEPVWERIWGQNREGAAGYFGDLSSMFEVDRARVVHNQTLTVELIDTLQDKLEHAWEDVKIAQEEAKLAELKQQAAEERQQQSEEYEKRAAEAIQTFCSAMEKEVFPPLIEGEKFLQEHMGVDISKFKAAIESRIQEGAVAQAEARDVHLSAAQAAAESQDQKLKELEDQLKVKGDELTQAKAEASNVQLELNEQKTSSSKLSEDLEKSKKDLEESQKRLADAEALLQVRLYTQEEYEMGYINGFKVARRLALHAETSLDWSKCALWAQNPEDPHMLYATPAEHEILQAEQAEEEAERQELEAEQRAAKAQARAQPASSAAGAETAPGLDLANQPDPSAEA
ncbi:plectin-like [Chenopodium quinoa]|uniref:plectin-like n=1 Tax=Chenopodium quinoa TaxID=63459 RepID=UPI000B77B167|nr:plectin-like [Chenopodium quinoa]